MKKIKNICLLGLLFLSLLFNIDNVHASTENTFYSEKTCAYKYGNEKIIIIRKLVNNSITNTFIKLDQNNNVIEKKENLPANGGNVSFSTNINMYSYRDTTECPTYIFYKVDTIASGTFFGAEEKNNNTIYYELLKPEEYPQGYKMYSGENIYDKLSTKFCHYRVASENLTGKNEYGLIFKPTFFSEKNGNRTLVKVKFDVIIEKPYYINNKYEWTSTNEKPNAVQSNFDILNGCPQYAHYNPPDFWGLHEYVINDSAEKPKNWNEHFLLPKYDEYVDLTNQLNEMDKIFKNFARTDDIIREALSVCFPDGMCGGSNIKANCLTAEKMSSYNKLIEKSYNDAIASIKNIKLKGNKTIEDLSEEELKSSVYKEFLNKHTAIMKSIEEKFISTSKMIDCTYEKLINQTNITEEEKETLQQQYELSKETRDRIISEIQALVAKYRVNTADLDCSYLLDAEILEWLEKGFLFIQIGSVVLVIVLGMLDFSKAVTASEDDAMKKAWQRFIKRIIAVACLILLPLIIEFVLGLIDIPGLTNKNPLCK